MISPARRLARAAISLAMVAVGVLHFVRPEPFVRIMPSALPWPLALVWLSGACEMALGAGFAFERTKRLAGWGLVALFVAVFPANVNMAINQIQLSPGGTMPVWAMWARLPLQLVFIGLVLWAGELRLRRA